jgi:hypothetical protein
VDIVAVLLAIIAFLNANGGVFEFLSFVSFLPFAFLLWASGQVEVLWRLAKRRLTARNRLEREAILHELEP